MLCHLHYIVFNLLVGDPKSKKWSVITKKAYLRLYLLESSCQIFTPEKSKYRKGEASVLLQKAKVSVILNANESTKGSPMAAAHILELCTSHILF